MDAPKKVAPTQSEGRHGEAASEIQLRRERGRNAQAAFRKRQIDTIRKQEEQIRSLNRAFGMVDQTRYQLKTAIVMFKALGSGGLPTQLADDFLQQLEQAIQQVPKDVFQHNNQDSTSDRIDANAFMDRQDTELVVQRSRQTVSQNMGSSHASPTTEDRIPESTTTRYAGVVSGHLSSFNPGPERGCGHDGQTFACTSLQPSLSITVPPIDMLPYLPTSTHSSQTFAYKLYWAGVSFAYQLVIGTDQGRATSRMFTYHARRQSIQALKKKLGARLAIQKSGIMHVDVASHSSPMYAELILQDMVDNGEDVHRYLCASDVELYFRRKYVDPENLQSSNPAFMADPSQASKMSALLVQYLTARALCFGDGPKYHVDDVDKAFNLATGGAFAKFPALNAEDYITASTMP